MPPPAGYLSQNVLHMKTPDIHAVKPLLVVRNAGQSTFVLFCLLCTLAPLREASAGDSPVDYTRDIKPIFQSRCYKCHGPDKQRGMLRLDTARLIKEGGESGPAITPADAQQSLLVKAITEADKGWRMPPEDVGEPLKPAQIELIRRWINQGAQAPDEPQPPEPRKHWAFDPPKKAAPPLIKNPRWSKNPIDAFIAANHDKLGLAAAPPAAREILIRRLYLDLIGLPPNPGEVRAFVEDPSPDAYEKIVDRLLASSQYGQRWGRHWMDIWRYSDWYGFGQELRNSQYHMWRWRDWIIGSLNSDKGYDRMVQEMLAGDELAPDDPNTLRATGFLARNWFKFNRNVWLDATIEHTSKAFLGVTMNCVRCHEHKYDPFSHRDYYRFRAFFEPHDVRTHRLPGQPDTLKDGLTQVYDAKPEEPTYRFLRGNEAKADQSMTMKPGLPKALGPSLKIEPVALPPEVYYPGLKPHIQQESLSAAQTEAVAADKSLAASQEALKTVWAEREAFKQNKAIEADPLDNRGAFIHDTFAQANPALWQIQKGQWVYTGDRLVQQQVAMEQMSLLSMSDHPPDFHVQLRLRTTGGTTYRSVGISFDVTHSSFAGVYLSAMDNGSSLNLWLRTNGADQYPSSTPTSLHKLGQQVTLDIAVRGPLLNAWVNGQFMLAYRLPAARTSGKLSLWTFDASGELLEFKADALPAAVKLAEPGQKTEPPKKLEDFDKRVAASEGQVKSAQAKQAAAQADLLSVRLRIMADNAKYGRDGTENKESLVLSAAQADRLAQLRQAEAGVIEAELAKAAGAADAATKLDQATKNLEQARQALGKADGEYRPLTPIYPQTSTGRRLALARWITDRSNPLAARVAVNHIWTRHFGQALAPTVFDFGANGSPPNNPQLLDSLAVWFMEQGWSMKAMHKLIVTSEAYRMASEGGRHETANLRIDPDNHHLWRQNVRRMEAEVVRDSLLHLGGTLDLSGGGPELDPATLLTTSRRSLYYRHAPEKQAQLMLVFDTASATECYRRDESIVPQQALAMVNSTLTLEQSRRFTAQLYVESDSQAAGGRDPQFVQSLFEHLLCRLPSAPEMAQCLEFIEKQTSLLSEPQSLTAFGGKVVAHVKPAQQPHRRACENLTLVLMNHNDFITIR